MHKITPTTHKYSYNEGQNKPGIRQAIRRITNILRPTENSGDVDVKVDHSQHSLEFVIRHLVRSDDDFAQNVRSRRPSLREMRRRSNMEKSVKFQAKRQSNIQEINRTSMTNDTEYTSSTLPRYMFHPDSPGRYWWDIIIMLFVLYTAAVEPFDVSFGLYRPPIWRATDVIMDFMFIADVVVNFRTCYLTERGFLVTDPSAIAIAYLRSWFIVDIFASIPSDTIELIIGDASSNSRYQLRNLRMLKALRLLRLGRLIRFQTKMELANIWKMFTLLFLIIGVAHWVGCFLYFIGTWQLEYQSRSWLMSRDHVYILGAKKSEKYWSCYVIALKMLLGGIFDPTTNAERIYYSISRFIGAFLNATIFGQMALQLQNLARARTRFQEKMDNVNEIMRNLALPKDLQNRVRNYLEYNWVRTKCLSYGTFFRDLSPALSTEVHLCMYLGMIQSVPVFQGVGADFLVALVTTLSQQIYLPGDLIIREGERGKEMYFINKGRCEVIILSKATKKNFRLVKEINRGEYFGEISILYSIRRTASVRACTYCDLSVLTKDSLEACMENFPESADIVRSHTHERLTEVYTDLKTNRERNLQMKVNTPKRSNGSVDGQSKGVDKDLDETLQELKAITEIKKQLDNLQSNENLSESGSFGQYPQWKNATGGSVPQYGQYKPGMSSNSSVFPARCRRFSHSQSVKSTAVNEKSNTNSLILRKHNSRSELPKEERTQPNAGSVRRRYSRSEIVARDQNVSSNPLSARRFGPTNEFGVREGVQDESIPSLNFIGDNLAVGGNMGKKWATILDDRLSGLEQRLTTSIEQMLEYTLEDMVDRLTDLEEVLLHHGMVEMHEIQENKDDACENDKLSNSEDIPASPSVKEELTEDAKDTVESRLERSQVARKVRIKSILMPSGESILLSESKAGRSPPSPVQIKTVLLPPITKTNQDIQNRSNITTEFGKSGDCVDMHNTRSEEISQSSNTNLNADPDKNDISTSG